MKKLALLGIVAAIGLGGMARPINEPPAGALTPAANAAPAVSRTEGLLTGEDIDRADLSAQQRMALATEQLTRLTRWQVWIAAAGTAFVIASLVLSALATRAGFRAAHAAEAALVSQERPRMMVKEISVANWVNQPESIVDDKVMLTLAHQNHGDGIGWINRHGFQLALMPGSSLPPEPWIETSALLWPIAKDAWWGIANGEIELPEEARTAITNGDSRLFLLGSLFYSDLRDGKYELSYVYVLRTQDWRFVPQEHVFWRAT